MFGRLNASVTGTVESPCLSGGSHVCATKAISRDSPTSLTIPDRGFRGQPGHEQQSGGLRRHIMGTLWHFLFPLPPSPFSI